MLARHRIRGCLFAARAKQNSRPPFAAASSSTVLSATLPSRRQSYTEIQQQQIYCFPIRLFSTSNSPTASTYSPILLNPDFALKQEWAERLKHLGKEKLGYDAYEWITLIQKKFTGGGKASAVDLDIACALAQRVDQIRDLLDLCYRFRHTDNAGDLFPSTEYAFLRLLLDYDDMGVFWKLLNDPINYGLFPDEHICSMYLNYFLTAGRLSEAARLAVYVMQQELFDFPLLNHLATRALLQFVEEPTADGPTSPLLSEFGELEFPRQAQTLEEELSFNEENVRIFRFPWLKVPHSDGHFDLNRTDQMVGKSLEWLSWHLKLADDASNRSKCETLSTGIRCLGLVLQQKFMEAKEELEKTQLKELLDNPGLKSILISALQLARPFLLDNAEEKKDGAEQKEVEEDSAEKRQQLLALVDQICGMTTAKDLAPKRAKLWSSLQQAFQPIQSIEERKVMDHQRQAFRQWEHKRFEFIESQTRRLELNLRLEEIGRRRKELAEQKDLLLFFDNRHIWEDKALQRHELEFHLGMLKKKGELTEDEYAKGLFQMGQLLKEGKTAAQALEQIQPGLGADIRVAKAKTTRK